MKDRQRKKPHAPPAGGAESAVGDLTRREALYRQIFDQAGDGIVTTDLAGSVLMANRAARRLLGTEAPVGTALGSYLTPFSARRLGSCLRGFAAGNVLQEQFEAQVPGRDGTRTLELRAVPLLEGPALTHAEFLLTDISARLQDEERRRKLRERAVVAGLSRHLSHVLLNAVTSAGGFVGMLRREQLSAERRATYLGIISGELERMEAVVRGYQDYVGILGLSPGSRQSARELLAGFLRDLRLKGDPLLRRVFPEEAGVTLSDPPPDGPDAVVTVDPTFLRLGLAYLLRGALHAARLAGRTDPVFLGLSLRVADGRARFTVVVRDVCVPPSTIDALHAPWEHQMLSQSFDDWGITIAAAVAERHGGFLETGGDSGETIFALDLPAGPEPSSGSFR